jgi:nitroimidazol reductase NimA-like FMN-containing flavoprotein (pyridoxamine 5'-phosphate oxidase superfamily)
VTGTEFDYWRSEGAVERLADDDCWLLLNGSTFGRLALSVADQPEIFPVNYYSDGSSILFRTAEGTKLLELTINSSVAFESDGYTDEEGWSVVVKGTAHALETHSEIVEANSLPLTPWIPTIKQVYVRITPTEISGRRFQRGPEPARY